jgi:hypothetical protein
MHSAICNGQIRHSFSFAFLEAYTSDMYYRLSIVTRTPTTPTLLPGNPVEVITANYSPCKWAQAFMTGFNSITAQFDSPLSFQTNTLRRQGQPHYPLPSHKPVLSQQPRQERDLPEGRERDAPPAPGAATPTGTSNTTWGVPYYYLLYYHIPYTITPYTITPYTITPYTIYHILYTIYYTP